MLSDKPLDLAALLKAATERHIEMTKTKKSAINFSD